MPNQLTIACCDRLRRSPVVATSTDKGRSTSSVKGTNHSSVGNGLA